MDRNVHDRPPRLSMHQRLGRLSEQILCALGLNRLVRQEESPLNTDITIRNRRYKHFPTRGYNEPPQRRPARKVRRGAPTSLLERGK